jgi:peptide/nickel transport system ATP-binding protein/oligopeptide transport system ATP-binding protein
MPRPLLEVNDLKTEFHLARGVVHAVNNVSFELAEGEVLGIVGESGSGKSVTALSILRLIDLPGRIVSGQVMLHDDKGPVDLMTLSPGELEHIRGNKISMIFQDPMTSLNPVLTVGYQLIEPLKQHRGMSEAQAKAEAIKLLARVGIPQAHLRIKDYPHQFSGGMRQRVMIAMALACRPKLLIADEPTTALDVTIQAQIVDLINELKDEEHTAVIIITHDLGVIASMADHVAVMYAGHIVELGPVRDIFNDPQHPYTQALLGAVPRLHNWPERLTTIEGAPPSLTTDIVGCPFYPRCPVHVDHCLEENPPLVAIHRNHSAACWVAQANAGLPVALKTGNHA